jgi:zinc protease
MLKAFHKAHITPANTVLSIVGDIEPQAAFALVKKNFSSWTGGARENIDVAHCAAAATAGKRINNVLADKTSVEVVIGAPAAYDIHGKDFYAAALANAALGHDTLSSRLAELRNKHGLTYGISSWFSENAFPNGAWMIDFTVNPENLNKSLPLVDQILANYKRTGITRQELDNEANRLAGEYIIERMRGPRQLADALAKYEILDLGAKFMDEYPQRLKAVSVQDANKAIAKYFDAAKLVTSIAGTLPAPKK